MFYMLSEQMYEGDDFQPRFVFEAKDAIEAKLLKARWCRYHSFSDKTARVAEEHDPELRANWIHNEYVDFLRK